jgi:hypothetical protein
MIQKQHHFTIADKMMPGTDTPFGPEYEGQFKIRRPSIADKKIIALKDAASMNIYGPVNFAQIGEGTKLLSYICTFVSHIAEDELPKWFDPDKLYSGEDEDAILAVWEEVQAFLATFRLPKNSGNGGMPEGEFAPVVP